MYRCGHHNRVPERYGSPYSHPYPHQHVHHHNHHNWRTDCSYCRHRIHNAYNVESNPFKWFRLPGTFVSNFLISGTNEEDVYPTSSENQPKVSRRGSKSIIKKVSSTKHLGHRSKSHSDSRLTAKVRRQAASMGTTKHNDSGQDPDADAVTKTDSICGFACGSALRNLCATPPPACIEAGTSAPPEKTVTTNEPPSPSPSRPCQSLFSNALRETPLFVKHESIQTTPSHTRTRSAFVVIGKDGESAGAPIGRSRSPFKDNDTKTKPPTEQRQAADTDSHPPPCQPGQPGQSGKPGKEDADHHHHHHYHGNVCWYHQVRESCGHRWAHAFHHHEPCKQHHSKLKDDGETTWAGVFINISKDDWGGLLKEAWTRITNIIGQSRSTILLERNLSPKPGAAHAPAPAPATASASATLRDSGEPAETVLIHDHLSQEEHAAYCYGHATTSNACFYNQNYYQHLEASAAAAAAAAAAATENNFFYPEKEPYNHSHFQEGPEEFYDCFECQVCSSHQY